MAYQIMRNTALFIALILLLACTQKWQITVVGENSLGPILCFAHGSECTTEGIQLSIISVREVTPSGGAADIAWLLEGSSDVRDDYVVRRLTYGTPLNGWTELVPAKPIKVNVFYSLNGEYYFIRDEGNRYRVYSREEFYSK